MTIRVSPLRPCGFALCALPLLLAGAMSPGQTTASAPPPPPLALHPTPQSADAVRLVVGKPVGREIGGGQTHRYLIELETGQLLDATVEQKGVDVAVVVLGPGGETVLEVDSPNGTNGPEPVLVVAERFGDYTIEVKTLDPSSRGGRYEARIGDIRTATEKDRRLVEATRLFEQSVLLSSAGRHREALELAERAMPLFEQLLGPEHPLTAGSLNNLASLYQGQGQYATAEPLFVRALAIREKAFGPEHPVTTTSLNNLAVLYAFQGQYAKAEPLYVRALGIRERALGPEHPDTANSVNNLAGLYYRQGQYSKAEPLYVRALAIRENALGPEHPVTAASLNQLASLFTDQGQYAKAEPLSVRALAIFEKALGPEHPRTAASLNFLAILYASQGQYSKAEPLYVRALAIRENALGPEHPDTAQSLNNLAGLYEYQGRFAKVEALHVRALAIREKALGPEHPETALSLRNLAMLYGRQGQYAKAETLFVTALAIHEKALGPEHPETAFLLNNLAWLYSAMEQYPRAIFTQARANEARDRDLQRNLASGSEREKLLYLQLTSGELDRTISLHAQRAPSDQTAERIALEIILRRKGRALDAMTRQIETLRRSATPENVQLLDELAAERSALSRLTLAGPGREGIEAHRARIDALGRQVEHLQSEIGRRSAQLAVESMPITLDAVCERIPRGARLVEFASYRPWDPKTRSHGPHRYMVYVTGRDGRIASADLAEAARIDTLVAEFRTRVRSKKTDVDAELRTAARRLERAVMEPVRRLAGASRQLLISPDGDLNLVPFAALVDERGKYLVETWKIQYLTSGRDLLRLAAPREGASPPLLLADPDFGQIAEGASRPEGTADDLSDVYFTPLSGTAEEARQIEPLLPGVRVLTQAKASEAALKTAAAPRLLHIATHGFFLEESEPETPAADGERKVVRVMDVALSSMDVAQAGAAVAIENPLLRSGLAFAGANSRAGSEGNDGILTALEATGLNLWGTRLVVLSACDTGVGEVKTGDGVYGLRRALTLGGAETTMVSLWPVSDAGTRDLMIEFYKRLLAGESRAEALRTTQLRMIIGRRYRHPYYWASFIQSGAWGPLESASR